MFKCVSVVLLGVTAAFGADVHPTLAIGSAAPSFRLPGVDGQMHSIADYAGSKVLVVVFTCNHCPIAQMYETRISQLAHQYGGKGVAVVAIQPNDPSAIRIDELDSSDVSDTLEEMKIRAEWKHLDYPYLYDGDTQETANAYGPQATPHVFVFDQQRKLRYEGRMDDSYRKELVKVSDARNAIDALLADRPVPVAHTGVFGCSTKWKSKQKDRMDAIRKWETKPVTVDMASADDLQKLRRNSSGKLLLINFWATWCGPCIHELPDLETTYQMYEPRDFALSTVSANMPDEKSDVLQMLERQHASTRNLLFASSDSAGLQKAFDPEWEGGVPYTVLLGPDGKVLYREQGELDVLKLRRTILANLPAAYKGFQQYWSEN